ncbi:MAG TPA: ATP-binding cassette domain-containing protein [Cyclobacteriaceae bacterium]|nr:ATP-binding cassette domain-containing protein [Cyclobacteriaceae bacterium]HRJ82707.1 ATP-binding cassette domain-containing protein [Cyclobacteriaceae bacterium]
MNETPANIVDIEQLNVNKLTFRFPGRARLLKDISLSVKKGEVIAMLGESGGGKSSFLQIIQKFYKPESGTIEVNGIDLDRISTLTWRDLIGVVPQEVKIFNGNLLYNLTLSDNPNEYQSAIVFCKQAGFDKYFESFPQSYLTILGEEGINISGGQKQVVALARALFRQPKLLLLDEATAAMDKNTEAFVLQLLMNLKQNTAVILVTHRIQTARKADRIYILDAGEIVASGTPETLMESVNFYSESVNEFFV